MSSTDLTIPELISPEGLVVAQAYLMVDGDMQKTAIELDMSVAVVQQILSKREVKAYVDRVYEESGFRNKHKIGKVMDQVIALKLEEMDDTELGSAKDISELLQIQHKMSMEHMAMRIKMLELEAKKDQQTITNQTNVQVNALAGGEGYNALLEKLLGGPE